MKMGGKNISDLMNSSIVHEMLHIWMFIISNNDTFANYTNKVN